MVLLARFVVSGSMKQYLVPHLLVSPVLTAWHCGAQWVFAIEYYNVTDMEGFEEALENIMLPASLFRVTSK